MTCTGKPSHFIPAIKKVNKLPVTAGWAAKIRPDRSKTIFKNVLIMLTMDAATLKLLSNLAAWAQMAVITIHGIKTADWEKEP